MQRLRDLPIEMLKKAELSLQSLISNKVCIYLWQYDNIIEISESNNGSHLFKSLRYTCNS